MTTSIRADTIRASAAPTAAADASLAWRRVALWGLLGAKVVASWGVQWDIQWHTLIGRDSFWIAPHLMTYAGVAVMVGLSFGVLAWPIDDLWHRLFGLDVTLWSPPHLLGLLGAMINTLGCFRIAREVYPATNRVALAAVVCTGTILYIGLHFALQPSFRIAYLNGGVLFHLYAMLASLVLPLALVATAQLSGVRWTPAVVMVGAVALGLVGMQIARVGFDLLQPVSVIEAEIAKDPTSPIAVAYLVARKNGTPPGATASLTQLLGLLPVAAMIVVDPRRRPVAATVAYALVLFALMAVRLAFLPAFRPLVPGTGATLVALGLTLVAGVAGGWVAGRIAAALGPAPRSATS